MTGSLGANNYADFDSAAHAVLAFLHQRLGFGLWMIARVEGDHWVALQTENHAYDLDAVTVFRWADTFCARMVQRQGPRVAPRASDIQAYLDAPIGQQIPIGAYIGVPLLQADGRLFGTLCGFDPEPQPASVADELGLVELLAGLLGTALQFELAVSAAQRRAEQAKAEALTDALTGLYNRRGWDTLLTGEEARCRRYGHPACVISLAIAGRPRADADALRSRVAALLQQNARAHDTVARVGDNSFAILGVECDRGAAEAFVGRIQGALDRAGIAAALGLGIRDPAADLYHAWEVAERAVRPGPHA